MLGAFRQSRESPLINHPPLKSFAAVLDTNVVLDWLVFRNAACQRLAAAIQAGQLRWLASNRLRDELSHVLQRGTVDAWLPNLPELWDEWHRHVQSVEDIPPSGAALRIQCSDVDDQKFINLALAHKARWLISRDRAVLKLAKRARAQGLLIVTPGNWLPEAAIHPPLKATSGTAVSSDAWEAWPTTHAVRRAEAQAFLSLQQPSWPSLPCDSD
jgi:putative PIN family toxin of toxin-antitoxin system